MLDGIEYTSRILIYELNMYIRLLFLGCIVIWRGRISMWGRIRRVTGIRIVYAIVFSSHHIFVFQARSIFSKDYHACSNVGFRYTLTYIYVITYLRTLLVLYTKIRFGTCCTKIPSSTPQQVIFDDKDLASTPLKTTYLMHLERKEEWSKLATRKVGHNSKFLKFIFLNTIFFSINLICSRILVI